jgi:hypothetical protein
MSQILAYAALGLLLAIGLGLFVYNMFLARQGWSGMQAAKKQKSAADAEFAQMRAMVDRSNTLREKLKEHLGDDYAEMIEPIDAIIAHSVSAFAAGDGKNGKDLLAEACYEMESMLGPQSA